MEFEELSATLKEVSNLQNLDRIELIKTKLREKDSDIYQEWERDDFNVNYQFTLEYGRDTIKTTLLHVAAKNGSTEVLEFLIDNGADVNAKDNDSATPLHGAAINGRKDIIELLLENGANVNAKGGSYEHGFCSGSAREDCTPLHLAVASGYLRCNKTPTKIWSKPFIRKFQGGNTTISLWLL